MPAVRLGPQRRFALLGLIPFLAAFFALIIAPFGYAVWMSLHSEQSSGLGFGGVQNVFVGLANYADALQDPAFRSGFVIIVAYCVIYIPLMVGGGVLLALLLDSAFAKFKSFARIALFLPHLVPGVIIAIVWMYLYTPGVSPVIPWIEALGVEWGLTTDAAALLAVANISLWTWTGYNAIIFFASLQAVPRDVLEAATVDGAGAIRTALRIKIPLIKDAVLTVTLFTCVSAFQLFDAPKILQTRGAPAIDSTWTPNMYILTKAFESHNPGLASAASLMLAILMAGVSYVVTRFLRRKSAWV